MYKPKDTAAMQTKASVPYAQKNLRASGLKPEKDRKHEIKNEELTCTDSSFAIFL